MKGIPRRELLVAGVASGALGLSGCSNDASDAGGGNSWTRVHLASGTEPWSMIPISGTQTDPVGGSYVVSVDVAGNLRFSSSAKNSESNRREVWVTGDAVADVEVRTVIAPPSAMDPDLATPQMGLALRISEPKNGKRSAFVFDTNIFKNTYRETWCAIWEWSDPVAPQGLEISDATEPTTMFEYRTPIRRVQRVAGSPATDVLTLDTSPLPIPKFVQGDRVDVIATVDESYAQNAARVEFVGTLDFNDAEGPLIHVENAQEREASPVALEAGYVRYTEPKKDAIDPRSIYPLHVAARVAGKVAQLKVWAVGSAEPSWSSPYQAVTVDFSDVTDVAVPDSGQVGLLVNHLHGADQFVAYGDVQVTPLG